MVSPLFFLVSAGHLLSALKICVMIALIFFQKRLGLKLETLRILCEIFDCFVLVGDDVDILDEYALYLEKMDKTVYIETLPSWRFRAMRPCDSEAN